MRHRVKRPEIAGIDRERRFSRRFRRGAIAALLAGEAEAGEDGAIAPELAPPFRQNAFGRGAHRLRPPEPEIVEMRETEGEQIARVLRDDPFPGREGPREIAGD